MPLSVIQHPNVSQNGLPTLQFPQKLRDGKHRRGTRTLPLHIGCLWKPPHRYTQETRHTPPNGETPPTQRQRMRSTTKEPSSERKENGIKWHLKGLCDLYKSPSHRLINWKIPDTCWADKWQARGGGWGGGGILLTKTPTKLLSRGGVGGVAIKSKQ